MRVSQREKKKKKIQITRKTHNMRIIKTHTS